MKEIFQRYLRSKRLKLTGQRELILKSFLGVKTHVSAEELYARIRRKDPTVGQATIFRFLKLLVEAGIAQSSGLGGKMARYEPKRRHHDHLVCTECGTVVEFKNPTVEEEQQRIASKHGFVLKDHRMELYGLCPGCKKGRGKRGRA